MSSNDGLPALGPVAAGIVFIAASFRAPNVAHHKEEKP